MPRLGVDALRWLLVLLNLAALGGAVFLGQRLVMKGVEDQVRSELPGASVFAVPEEVEKVFDSRQVNRIQGLWKREKPKPPAPVEAPPQPDLPEVADGGPLSGWEIAYVVIPPGGGLRGASIQEKQVETAVPGVGARPPTTARRAPTSRSARRSVRTPRRVAAPQAQVGRSKYVREGVPFRIEDSWFTPVRISATPDEEMEFKDEAGRTFVLLRENFPEAPQIEENDGVLVLRGLSPEDLQDEAAPGQPATQAVPDDRRGEVQRGGVPNRSQPQRTTPGRREPAATPSQPQRRSPTTERRADLDRQRAEARRAIQDIGNNESLTPQQKQDLLKAGRALENPGPGKRGGGDQ